MLTLQKAKDSLSVSFDAVKGDIENLLGREWLLSNRRGGYSSSTIIGCNTRRYHGLLIGSLDPPVNRIMALSGCQEMVISQGRTFELSTFEFDHNFSPSGFGYIKRFRKDAGVHFDYQLDGVELTKSIYLLRNSDTVALVYDFTALKRPVEFTLRPFVGLRDFHSLQKSYANLRAVQLADGQMICHDIPKSCELFLLSHDMEFVKDGQWWFNFVYRQDQLRGQDFTEDLWTPGFYRCQIEQPAKIVFWANIDKQCHSEQISKLDIESVCAELEVDRKRIFDSADTSDKVLKQLSLAADEFVVERTICGERQSTILAGFPWFADWGRDAFISLPGLLLCTGRSQEAKSVLTMFAGAIDDGMVPNRFDDRTNTAHFNSVDASLWFINAAFQYLEATGDSSCFSEHLLPAICRIVDSFRKGTRFGIHADEDGLICAGSEDTQLTWMDARFGGVAFTPRYGKAVEINSLWYNALCLLGRFYTDRDVESAKIYHSMADKVEAAFRKFFYNEITGYLNDCILDDGTVDSSLRPNQIFAVSLPFSPLSAEQQKSVVKAVQQNLLTPFGLRTLNEQDMRYQGQYSGPQQRRDAAYHQGTAWPYLMGAFVESFLKVNDFSKNSRKKAAGFIEPLLYHLTETGCIGSVSEIFDGSFPQMPKGCIAQAWSVAELIRAYKLIH